jgi:hypothetical protein
MAKKTKRYYVCYKKKTDLNRWLMCTVSADDEEEAFEVVKKKTKLSDDEVVLVYAKCVS